jgi:acetyl esterase/lipase
VKDYCGTQDPAQPLISPLFADLHGLPPLFIQVGSFEMLRDEVILIAKRAKKSGVHVTLESWPEMLHCWQLFASKIPEGQEALDHIGAFIRKDT